MTRESDDQSLAKALEAVTRIIRSGLQQGPDPYRVAHGRILKTCFRDYIKDIDLLDDNKIYVFEDVIDLLQEIRKAKSLNSKTL